MCIYLWLRLGHSNGPGSGSDLGSDCSPGPGLGLQARGGALA